MNCLLNYLITYAEYTGKTQAVTRASVSFPDVAGHRKCPAGRHGARLLAGASSPEPPSPAAGILSRLHVPVRIPRREARHARGFGIECRRGETFLRRTPGRTRGGTSGVRMAAAKQVFLGWLPASATPLSGQLPAPVVRAEGVARSAALRCALRREAPEAPVFRFRGAARRVSGPVGAAHGLAVGMSGGAGQAATRTTLQGTQESDCAHVLLPGLQQNLLEKLSPQGAPAHAHGGETVPVQLEGLRVEVRALGRTHPPLPQAHGRQALPMPPLRPRLLSLGPPILAHEATRRGALTHQADPHIVPSPEPLTR